MNDKWSKQKRTVNMYSNESLKKLIQAELAKRLFTQNPHAEPLEGYPKYVQSPEQVLVPGVKFEEIEPDLRAGDGSELESIRGNPPKFQAAHSSAALVINTFGSFRRHPSALRLMRHSGFNKIRFEYKCPTGLSRSPNLDAVFMKRNEIVAIESKLTEPLEGHPAEFSDNYLPLVEQLADQGWMDMFDMLRREPEHYSALDAAQLVKHYLGLKRTFPGHTISLIYLYWDPRNAMTIPFFAKHLFEAWDFSRRVSYSMIPVSYHEVWYDLARTCPSHIETLRARYDFPVCIDHLGLNDV